MAYAVHIDPNASLGDESALAALFAEDTDEPGILDPNAGKEHRTQKDPMTAPHSTTATKTIAMGSPPNAKQERSTA